MANQFHLSTNPSLTDVQMCSAKRGTYSSKFRPCREALAELYTKLLLTYPIMLLEDPFEEDSFCEFTKFTSLVDCQVSAKMTCVDNSELSNEHL